MAAAHEARRLREQAGVSVRTMARGVGVRASTLICWEAGGAPWEAASVDQVRGVIREGPVS